MSDPQALAEEAAARLAELTGVPAHRVVVVLGSGWGPAADAFGTPVARFPMSDIDRKSVV